MHSVFLKLHVVFLLLSLLIFLARAVMSFTGSVLVNHPLALKMTVGSMLMVVLSAAGLCFTLGQYPFVNGWLTEKLLGLVVYIVLGVMALQPAMTKGSRAALIPVVLGAFALSMMIAKQHAGFFLP